MKKYEIDFKSEQWIINDVDGNYTQQLRDRLFKFAVEVFKYLNSLPTKKEFDVFRYQLSKSVTSIGANYEEAQGAYSRKDFSNKVNLSYKEARETLYFLRVLYEVNANNKTECLKLKKESEEISKILGAIFRKVKST